MDEQTINKVTEALVLLAKALSYNDEHITPYELLESIEGSLISEEDAGKIKATFI